MCRKQRRNKDFYVRNDKGLQSTICRQVDITVSNSGKWNDGKCGADKIQQVLEHFITMQKEKIFFILEDYGIYLAERRPE